MKHKIVLESRVLEAALMVFQETAKEAVIDGVHIAKENGNIVLWVEE